MTHRYAEALRWIADGKDVQFSHPDIHGWQDLTRLSQPALSSFFAGEGGWEFRLKPRTVKIGSREVEAPVLEPVEGQEVYWTAASGTENSGVFLGGNELMVNRARSGSLFASEEAARAAHEAVAALMRGES